MVERYTEYRMIFIRTTPGVRRDIEDWDFGLVNFGYDPCVRVDPIAIVARDLDDARGQAAQHWQTWLARPYDSEPEGYWICTPDDRIGHCYVHNSDGGEGWHNRWG